MEKKEIKYPREKLELGDMKILKTFSSEEREIAVQAINKLTAYFKDMAGDKISKEAFEKNHNKVSGLELEFKKKGTKLDSFALGRKLIGSSLYKDEEEEFPFDTPDLTISHFIIEELS